MEEKSKKRDEIEKESQKIEEVSSHKDEKYDGGAAASTEHTPSKVKETLLASSLSTNVDDMDVEDLLQLSLVAFAKAKERLAIKTEKRARVITRAVDRVNKLLPSPLTFQGGDDADNIDKALENFDSLFSSLEKATTDKAERILAEET